MSRFKCPECGSKTQNTEMRCCAAAEADERENEGVSPVQGTIGLISCHCCDKCREKCLASWQEDNLTNQ